MISGTLNGWAASLGMSPQILLRRLARNGIALKPREQINARNIFNAITGDKEMAMTRKLLAESEKVERENREADGQLISLAEADKLFGTKLQILIDRTDSQGAMLDVRLAGESDPYRCRMIMNEYNEQTKQMFRDRK